MKNNVKNIFSVEKDIDLELLLKEMYKVLYDIEQLQWDSEYSLVKTISVIKARQILKQYREKIKNANTSKQSEEIRVYHDLYERSYG